MASCLRERFCIRQLGSRCARRLAENREVPKSMAATTPATERSDARAFLLARVGEWFDALVSGEVAAAGEQAAHLAQKVGELVQRQLSMTATNSASRDLLGEVLFARLRAAMAKFSGGADRSAQRAAELAMATLHSSATLTEYAHAFDRALQQAQQASANFSFAGRTDFISVEEVLQMLCTGQHRGCLSLQHAHNQLDIYLQGGQIRFLDPHRPPRRVLPGDPTRHRQVAAAVMSQAQELRAKTQQPVLLLLCELAAIQPHELPALLQLYGKEALFEFMQQSAPFAYFYRRMDALPSWVHEHDLRMSATSVLLEGSKRSDDWRQLLAAFPDANAPVQLADDLLSRIGDLALSPLELNLLANLQTACSPQQLEAALGVPLFDVYLLLGQFAQQGLVVAQGDVCTKLDSALSVAESMQEAFAALRAIDAH